MPFRSPLVHLCHDSNQSGPCEAIRWSPKAISSRTKHHRDYHSLSIPTTFSTTSSTLGLLK